jgi:hypothetical protein
MSIFSNCVAAPNSGVLVQKIYIPFSAKTKMSWVMHSLKPPLQLLSFATALQGT